MPEKDRFAIVEKYGDFHILYLTSTQKAGVQRAAALCRGRGGVPRKFFFSFFAAVGGEL
jgi:hypothetical protein